MALLSIEELDRDALTEQAKQVVLAERQCRMTLAQSWPRPVALEWHPGLVGHRSLLWLNPGKSLVQPLSKVQCWFGPFAVYLDYRSAVDERKKSQLRDLYNSEKKRYLERYDYPRGDGKGAKPILTPTGPHRSPDVSVTILEADGTENETIRLYELYHIGEFDPIKDSFVVAESAEQVEARYQQELATVNERYERQAEAFRLEMAELRGMVGSKVASDGPIIAEKLDKQPKPVLSPWQLEQRQLEQRKKEASSSDG